MHDSEVNPVDAHVGLRVRQKRNKMHLSMAELATKMNVSMQQIQKYETGQTRMAASVLYTMAGALGCNPGYFFEGMIEEPAVTIDTISPSHRHPLNILVAEDSPTDELLLREALKSTEQETRFMCVHDGAQVLQALKKEDEFAGTVRPDILLMDLHMPKYSGLEILKIIKKDRILQDIPVIIVTNSVCAQEMLQVYKNQAAGYVCKSLDFDVFAENIKYLISYWAKVVALPNTSVA